jgi:hypothetical protein
MVQMASGCTLITWCTDLCWKSDVYSYCKDFCIDNALLGLIVASHYFVQVGLRHHVYALVMI